MISQCFETSDIVLAATLKVMGTKLEKIEKQGNRGIFCFRDVDAALLMRFDLGQALVDPVAFNHAIKALTTAARRIN